MTIGQFRLGYRTLKTALSVAICILIFSFFDNHTPVIACLSAIVALREDMSQTYSFGGLRVLGTIIGSLAAVLYYFMQQPIQNKDLATFILIPIFVGLLIIVSDGLNLNKGIVASEATFLIIIFTIPQSQALLYIFERTFDSFIGVFIALTINRLIKPPADATEEEVNEVVEELVNESPDPQTRISELEQELAELRKKITNKTTDSDK
ncbi:FUSC family protein [Vagococcus zengguangii]|uniref:Uncharacterized protein n=1 Tax=Vagococcus zengguangii TaxID=2571750 RepID=A0A4D7CU77_9ENTE|nr:aromatic acid exporter family protein [Vagococcus zengguangii]QCI86843.1 hypothetical protein FA707_07640 [Vagococcus zengguangii]TLG80449.1 hypothetical protein FE258_05265 [Vagococcus zengguangii]